MKKTWLFSIVLVLASVTIILVSCNQNEDAANNLYIVSVSPALDKTNVSSMSKLVATFSFFIDVSGMTTEAFFPNYLNYVTGTHTAGTTEVTKIAWSDNNRVMTLTVNGWSNLGPGSGTGEVAISATNRFKDVFGHDLDAGTVVWRFSVTYQTTTTTTTSTTTTSLYDSYFPMAAGQAATFEVSYYASLSGASSSTNESWNYVGTVTLSATRDVFQIDVSTGEAPTSYYYFEDSTGLYSYGSGSQPTTEATLLLPYPPLSGTTWESGTVFGPNEILAEEAVATPAGTFACIKVSYITYPGSWNYRWFSANEGLIKRYWGYAGIGSDHNTREVVSKNF